MSITIEDGTGVPNANSYASVSDVRAYCEQRAMALPSDDSALEALIVRAFDFINSQKYDGEKTFPELAHAFPRIGLEIDGYSVGNNEIPWQIVSAQCELAHYLQTNDVFEPSDGRVITKEKVDSLEVSYSLKGDGSASSAVPFPSVLNLLSGFFAHDGGVFGSFTVGRL